jgi:CPA2 family monovalent cation:H+ antiporter-2
MAESLEPLLILLAFAVIIVVLFRSLKLPAMLGYLIVGILIGPNALGLISSSEETTHLAEFGVVFLMFTLGLEFDLAKFSAMRRLVFGLGFAQVAATSCVIMILAMLAGSSWQGGFALGGALAMSSTAIVSKLLTDKQELTSKHGKNAVGILLFQDLAVVPLLILLPSLNQPANTLLISLGLALLKIVVALTVILFLGQKLMRPWFTLVAKRRSSELFIINVLLVTLGIAYVTELAGLSMALGAFLAGMLIAETPYRYQVEDDIRPFRDVLLGLFFVTVGMMLNIQVLKDWWWLVLIMLMILGPGKIFVITMLARALGNTTGNALRSGILLGQGGEFGFVLLALVGGSHLLPSYIEQVSLASIILSMLISPFLIQHSDKIIVRLVHSEWMNMAADLHKIAVQSMQISEHVIICGFGRSGQSLARLLAKEKIQVVSLDLDPEIVQEAKLAGENIVFGDAAKREVLLAAGLMRARAIIISYSDTHSALTIITHVREVCPSLPIIVRTQDDTDINTLREAGATEVVAEIMEGSLMLATQTFIQLGTPLPRVLSHIRTVREKRYELLQGFFSGLRFEDHTHTPPERLHCVTLTDEASAVGQQVMEINANLANFHVYLKSIRRNEGEPFTPNPDDILQVDDILILQGEADDLAAADMFLLQGN